MILPYRPVFKVAIIVGLGVVILSLAIAAAYAQAGATPVDTRSTPAETNVSALAAKLDALANDTEAFQTSITEKLLALDKQRREEALQRSQDALAIVQAAQWTVTGTLQLMSPIAIIFGFIGWILVKQNATQIAAAMGPVNTSLTRLEADQVKALLDTKRIDDTLRDLERASQIQAADARVELTKNREKGAEVETQLRSFEKIEEMRWQGFEEFKRAVLGRLYQYGEVTTPAPAASRAGVQIAHQKAVPTPE